MVFEKIKQILCEEFEAEEGEITLDSPIISDTLCYDELDFYDLIMSLEDAFEMEISDEALEDISTVGDMVKFIEENK